MPDKCNYCQGLKRIKDDLITYDHRQIIEIKHNDEMWYTLVTPNRSYKTMQYIKYCPMCGRDLSNAK